MLQNAKKVFVGLSGGVDSSVSAYLLKKEGYEVTGVFIKVWQPEGIVCTWKEDRLDAMRIAAQLDIPFITLDLEKEYKEEVIDYMIADYKRGSTPNPDVMCNKYVKFGGFLSFALASGADYVATGHYAQKFLNKKTGLYEIHAGDDDNKDQSYFLWTVPQEKLKSILFPVGSLPKPEVRKIAKKAGLLTADKKDSQGLCFIGKLNIKDFLKDYIEEKEGDILNEKGEVIGKHDGIFFYTLGERHGFDIDKKTATDEPFYIVAKDIEKNTLTVSHTSPADRKQELKLVLCNTNWISETPDKEKEYEARIRYRGSLAKVQINIKSEDEVEIVFQEGDFTAASGQSVVIYDGTKMIGGGIIK